MLTKRRPRPATGKALRILRKRMRELSPNAAGYVILKNAVAYLATKKEEKQ